MEEFVWPSITRKVPLLCLNCRLAFKTGLPVALKFDCPHCQNPLIFLGRAFHTPRHNDVKQWRKVELLWKSGWQADSYGGNQGPKTLRDAHDYIEAKSSTVNRIRKCHQLAENEKRWRLARRRKAKS